MSRALVTLMAFFYFLGMKPLYHILWGGLNNIVTWLNWQGIDHHPKITETKRNPQV
jgi:hypothetical protein